MVLAADCVLLVLHEGSQRPPRFASGGPFVRDTPLAEPNPSATGAVTTSSAGRAPAATAVATSTSTPRATATSTPRATATVSTSAPPPSAPSHVAAPRSGTYTFALRGTESASIVGSRSFPGRMTIVVHRGGGVGADDVVVDQAFSTEHEEREIRRHSADGVFLIAEGGSITFGLVTQSSDVTYEPPMGYVPFPLATGTSQAGTSTARQPDGTVARVDDWSVRIVGRESIVVAGAPTAAWVVQFDRRSRAGTGESVLQSTRSWFDAERGLAVKWEETVHGERDSILIRGSYDARYTATLEAYRAA